MNPAHRIFFPAGPAMSPSIATISARWHDGSELIEIELDDGQQRRGGGSVAEAIWQGVVPGGVLRLQPEQPGDQVVPALQAGAPVDWPSIADDRRWLGLAARAVARLAFGAAECVFTFGDSASGHGGISVT
jgi:hypothetical protein